MGVWRPGQEVKLAPLVQIFSQKIFKMVDPKQISVVCDKQKKKRRRKKKKLTKLKYIPISSETNY